MGSVTEEQNFKFYFILIRLHFNSCIWLVATLLGSTNVRFLYFLQKESILAKRIFSPLAFLPVNRYFCRVLHTAVCFVHCRKSAQVRGEVGLEIEPVLGSSRCMS